MIRSDRLSLFSSSFSIWLFLLRFLFGNFPCVSPIEGNRKKEEEEENSYFYMYIKSTKFIFVFFFGTERNEESILRNERNDHSFTRLIFIFLFLYPSMRFPLKDVRVKYNSESFILIRKRNKAVSYTHLTLPTKRIV